MIQRRTLLTDSGDAGNRLDAWLAKNIPSSTRALCREAILSGLVAVNGRPCRNKGLKLTGRETVEITEFPEVADICVKPDASVRFKVLFEDGSLIAVNKPAGIPVQPLSRSETGTLMNGMVHRYPDLSGVGDSPLMAGALHRIDTETSGLVLAARNQRAFDAIREQFKQRTFVKTYYALVDGHVALPGSLHHHLAHDPTVDYCRMIDANTVADPDLRMEAITCYQPERWVGKWTLLKVTIKTGVTHQIRCQLALAGFPIVGDRTYGGPMRIGDQRHFLHAFAVDFLHPDSGTPCRIEAPLTEDFLELL